MRKAIDKDTIVEFDVHMIVVEVVKKYESNRIPSIFLFHAHLSASLTCESLLSDRPLLSLPQISNCAQ